MFKPCGSFSVSGLPLWNSLSDHICNPVLGSVSFRTLLKMEFLSSCSTCSVQRRCFITQCCLNHNSMLYKSTVDIGVVAVQQSSVRSALKMTQLMIQKPRRKTRGSSTKHAEATWLHCRPRCCRWQVSLLLQWPTLLRHPDQKMTGNRVEMIQI